MNVYIVYVRYSTGDTFSHTNGCGKILEIFDNYEEAQKLEKSVEDNSYKGYKFWDGYFESLESVNIEILPVL